MNAFVEYFKNIQEGVDKMTDIEEIKRFLADLSENNNKEWFHANRQRYDQAKKASETLCAELIDGIRTFDPYVGTLSPKECLFRIFRDTRFAKDKSPYRTGFAMFVARGGKNDVHHGYFFQIGAGKERSCVAAGHYFCPAQVLGIVREDIQMGNGDFRQVLSQVDSRLQMDYSGSYKKTPAGFPTDGPDAAFYRLRNFRMGYFPDEDFLTAPHLVERLLEIYKSAKPFVDYINRAIDYNQELGFQ